MLRIISLFSFCLLIDAQLLPTPRGVPIDKRPLYDRNGRSHFQCLDNSMTVPFEWVNDDYCDCRDGSDEPGTSACSNGRFYCLNLGHKPLDVPSSRVNDQICDCCDGSDEWAQHVKCPNYCDEAGRAAREEHHRLQLVEREGYEKKKEWIKAGQSKKTDNKNAIEQKNMEKDQLAKQLEELDMVKQVAEKIEKEAKDIHTERWKEELEARRKFIDKKKAQAAFKDLDTNMDQKLSYEELSCRVEFDRNLDGNVAEEEITEFFGAQKETELEHFVDEVWTNIKHIYRPPIPAIEKPAEPVEIPKANIPDRHDLQAPSSPDTPKDFDDKSMTEEPEDEIKEDEVEDYDKPHSSPEPPPNSSQEDDEGKMPDFDEHTKKLIADADQARKEYDDLDSKIKDIDKSIRNLEDYLKTDFGPEDEYAELHRQCFEFSDPQYTYGLCLFDRAYQKPKDGGHDTSLGHWDSWEERDGNKNGGQNYKNGMSCWNGPSRSTKVTFLCGTENRLVSASEPGRCEYAMEFQTPAACHQPQGVPPGHTDEHAEL